MQLVERDARAADTCHRRIALLALAVLNDVPSLGFVGDLEEVSRVRHSLQTEHFDGRRGGRVLDDPATIVKHRTDFAEYRPANEEVPRVQRAILHQDRCYRAASLIHA